VIDAEEIDAVRHVLHDGLERVARVLLRDRGVR
jgi:hypothetical protein